MDFTNYSLADLKEMLKELPAEIQRRELEARADTLAELERIAKERGYKLADLVASQKTEPTKAKKIVPAKYRNPDNHDETWTGRGRAPKWLESHPKEEREQFKIQ